jgi:hypothetical protein
MRVARNRKILDKNKILLEEQYQVALSGDPARDGSIISL